MPIIERLPIEAGKQAAITIELDEEDSEGFADAFLAAKDSTTFDADEIDRLIIALPQDDNVFKFIFHTTFHETLNGLACVCYGRMMVLPFKDWTPQEIAQAHGMLRERNQTEDFRMPSDLQALAFVEVKQKIIRPLLRDRKKLRTIEEIAAEEFSVKKVAAKFNTTETTVKNRIGKLVARGRIKPNAKAKTQNGKWDLSSAEAEKLGVDLTKNPPRNK